MLNVSNCFVCSVTWHALDKVSRSWNDSYVFLRPVMFKVMQVAACGCVHSEIMIKSFVRQIINKGNREIRLFHKISVIKGLSLNVFVHSCQLLRWRFFTACSRFWFLPLKPQICWHHRSSTGALHEENNNLDVSTVTKKKKKNFQGAACVP